MIFMHTKDGSEYNDHQAIGMSKSLFISLLEGNFYKPVTIHLKEKNPKI